MLSILGPGSRYCDGITRRSCLRIGALGLGGLALPQILQAESQKPSESKSGSPRAAKGIIMVILPGGPPHLDMFDMKPDAPAEIRGEFHPIPTNQPGIEICELMPRLATIADKFSIIRSLFGFVDDHNTHWCSTGWESHRENGFSPFIPGAPPGGWPSLGAVLSKQLGPRVSGIPAAVDLTPMYPDARFVLKTPPTQAGYLGNAYSGFEVDAVDRGNVRLNGTSLTRVSDRRTLLASFDRFRRQVDKDGMTDGLDEFHRQALDVLTSHRLAEALDLESESESFRARYGLTGSYPQERNGKTLLDQFLMARRVIEAGARCVTITFSRWPFGRIALGDNNWDWHKDIFPEARGTLPLFDIGLSAMLSDLSERGLLDEIAVVVWGEFGRSPKINDAAGRDHWPRVCSAMVAGGGMQCGQVIGSTTRWGEEPLTRPVHFREVFATLYQRLGIDIATTQLVDRAGRPQYLVGEHRPMPELMG